MRDPILEVSGLIKTFNSGSPFELRILRGIDLGIRSGSAIGITGQSGAGKTTLLSCLSLLDAPTSGSLYLFGQPTQFLTDRAKSVLRRDKIGFIFQDFQLFEDLPTWLNVCIGRFVEPAPMKQLRRQAMNALQSVELEARADHPARLLSGGEKQRLAFVRAIIGAPKILFADEPTSNLDPRTAKFLTKQLKGYVEQGGSLVIVSHDPLVIGLCHEIYEISEGKLRPKAPQE
ncbi:MAG: ATP-binding cassette domain-containing protein [Acidobacteria bacterium]|nr:ATP-binding cassette domain-containing protein [Acidobacteriota bacterium]